MVDNPLDEADVIFKDEGTFWTLEANTPAGRAFMKTVRPPAASEPGRRSTTHRRTVVSAKQAQVLMRDVERAGLSSFEF